MIELLYGTIALVCWGAMFFFGVYGIICGLVIGIIVLLFIIFVGCLGKGCGDEGCRELRRLKRILEWIY